MFRGLDVWLSLCAWIGVTCAIAPVPASAAGPELDWCAPVVIRPDQKFDRYPDCNWVWSKEEIATKAEAVYMSGETAVANPLRPPHPMTCWGDTTYENMAAYIDSVNALRPRGKPPIRWVAMVRFDLVPDTLAAQPGFSDSFLVKTRQPWSHVIDFFEKDRSGILTGKEFLWPTYETIAPVVSYLCGGEQGRLGTPEEAAEIDISAQEAEKEKAERERKELFDQIRTALVGSKSIQQLQTAWSLTNGKKTRLGDELFTQLQTIKDSRKAELLEVA